MENEIINSLKSFGFEGENIEDAILFCDEKINEYWVDSPVQFRDEEEKEFSEYCGLFKSYKKILKRLSKK